MKRRVVAVILAAAMTGAVITACGSDNASTSSGSAEEETVKDGYVSAEDAVEAAKAGGTHVLDVREWANYVEGRVVNSEWCPIFPLEDDSLAEGMTAYAEEHFQYDEDI